MGTRGFWLALTLLLVAVLVSAFGHGIWRRWLDLVPSLAPSAQISQGTAPETDPYSRFRHGMTELERFDKPGNLDRAVVAFEAALARDGNFAPAHAGLALAYWRYYIEHNDALRLEQALAVAERAVGLDEHLAIARVALGTIYAEAGRDEDARRELGGALQLDPSSAGAYRGLGLTHQRQGRMAEAIMAYEKAIELEPADSSLHSALGAAYYRVARYIDAERVFLRSIELAPDGVYGYRNLAAVYASQGRLNDAATILQKALEIQPAHSLYANLGGIFFAQGLYQPAAGAFEKALAHGGAHVYLYWANLADAYRQLAGQEPAAQEAYQRAIQLLGQRLEAEPERAKLRSRLVSYLAKSGDCHRASIELAQLTPRTDLKAEDHYRIAVAHEICGRRDQALDELNEALLGGFSVQEVARDPELFELRLDPRYHRQLAALDPR